MAKSRNVLAPPRDMTRQVRWPTVVQLQRKRAILLKRLKVPPAINQFSQTLNKNEATQLFRLLAKYRPETREAKKARLRSEAEARAAGTPPSSKKPLVVHQGLNTVTALVEQKRARLVIIAHDVDPIELVVFLPTLCKKMGVPFCIVKGKARLGALIHHKTAAALAIENVNKEDIPTLEQLIQNFNPNFLDNMELRRRWGGNIQRQK